jgi:uncharacterized membrane protein required for colicin V production
MVSLVVVFWMFVVLFAVIGSMRGWAKEILVTFSVILSLFIVTVLERFLPFVNNLPESSKFWLHFFIVAGLAFFGYQSPNLPRLLNSARFVREKLQDSLLGIFLGAANGYLITGTVWFFLDRASYPGGLFIAPDPNTDMGKAAISLLGLLPPVWLGSPAIYFAVAIAFVFVIVVFV